MADLTFYFDPLCPWSWRTSQWVREVQGAISLSVEWKVFSLAEANQHTDPLQRGPIRAAVLARREDGNVAVERLYRVLGDAIHEQDVALEDDQAIELALREGGFDGALMQRAMEDASTYDEVMMEHQEATKQYGAFGVPWLVFPGHKFGFYGPVITEVPQGSQAVDLWSHVSWLFTQPYLFEIKRERQ